MRSSVGVTLKGNSRHRDDRTYGESVFKIVVFRLTICESEPPAIVMNDNRNVIRVFEGRRAAVERGIIELPLRRSRLPTSPAEPNPNFHRGYLVNARHTKNLHEAPVRFRP
jgi:hypothetical protein